MSYCINVNGHVYYISSDTTCDELTTLNVLSGGTQNYFLISDADFWIIANRCLKNPISRTYNIAREVCPEKENADNEAFIIAGIREIIKQDFRQHTFCESNFRSFYSI